MGDFSVWFSLGIGMQKKLKNVTLKNDNISGLAQIGIILISYFSDFWSQLPSNSSKCKKLGVFWKIQEQFIPMAKDYQSEKSPIIGSQKRPKTTRKLLKMGYI